MHLDHIRAGLERGLKIFTEKPMVTTEAETMELARLIGEHGAERLMVGLVLRYAPLYLDLRKAQADGLLGDDRLDRGVRAHSALSRRLLHARLAPLRADMPAASCWRNAATTSTSTTGVMGCRPGAGRELRRAQDLRARERLRKARGRQRSRSSIHRKPSGWMGSDKVFDSDADIIDYQIAIIEYANGAAMNFHTNLNVPDHFRRFAIFGAQGHGGGRFHPRLSST